MNELSRQQLATELGISSPTLGKIEEGISAPDTDVLGRLVSYSGIQTEFWTNDELSLPDTTVPTQKSDMIIERLRLLIAEKSEGNLSEFSRLTGIEKTTLSRVLNGERRLQPHHMQAIEQTTRARQEWISTGRPPQYHPRDWKQAPEGEITNHEGQMLKRYLDSAGIEWARLAQEMNISKASAWQYQLTVKFRSSKRKEIFNAVKQILLDDGNAETSSQLTEEDVFVMPATSAPKQAPVPITNNEPVESNARIIPTVGYDMVKIVRIPVRARAGFEYEAYYNNPEKEYSTIRKDLIRPNVNLERDGDKVAVIVVDGDSMEPLLRPGYEVLAYYVTPGDWPYLTGTVAVAFRDQFVIKNVEENTILTEGMLSLHSVNKSGGTLHIPVNEIRNIWKIDRIVNGKL